MSEISRRTFEEASTKVQQAMLFDKCCTLEEKLEILNKKISRKTIIDKFYLVISGFIGGIFAKWIKL